MEKPVVKKRRIDEYFTTKVQSALPETNRDKYSINTTEFNILTYGTNLSSTASIHEGFLVYVGMICDDYLLNVETEERDNEQFLEWWDDEEEERCRKSLNWDLD